MAAGSCVLVFAESVRRDRGCPPSRWSPTSCSPVFNERPSSHIQRPCQDRNSNAATARRAEHRALQNASAESRRQQSTLPALKERRRQRSVGLRSLKKRNSEDQHKGGSRIRPFSVLGLKKNWYRKKYSSMQKPTKQKRGIVVPGRPSKRRCG